MSITRCHDCNGFIDTDNYPEAYDDADGNHGDSHARCENCRKQEPPIWLRGWGSNAKMGVMPMKEENGETHPYLVTPEGAFKIPPEFYDNNHPEETPNDNTDRSN